MINEQKELQDHVNYIAESLTYAHQESERESESEGEDSHDIIGDYLEGVLDLEYIVDAKIRYKSAILLVAFGGPNIWIDLHRMEVRGAWWGKYATATIKESEFVSDLSSYIEEIFNNTERMQDG